MANYNVQMCYYNGSSYDDLYPNVLPQFAIGMGAVYVEFGVDTLEFQTNGENIIFIWLSNIIGVFGRPGTRFTGIILEETNTYSNALKSLIIMSINSNYNYDTKEIIFSQNYYYRINVNNTSATIERGTTEKLLASKYNSPQFGYLFQQ